MGRKKWIDRQLEKESFLTPISAKISAVSKRKASSHMQIRSLPFRCLRGMNCSSISRSSRRADLDDVDHCDSRAPTSISRAFSSFVPTLQPMIVLQLLENGVGKALCNHYVTSAVFLLRAPMADERIQKAGFHFLIRSSKPASIISFPIFS